MRMITKASEADRHQAGPVRWRLRAGAACLALVLGWGGAQAQSLFDAARSGAADEVRASLAAGARVDAPDDAGDTALLLAARYNAADVVAVLLDAGADPQYLNPKTGMGMFGLAWRNPDGDSVRRLFRERGLVARVGAATDQDTEGSEGSVAVDAEGAPVATAPASERAPVTDARALPLAAPGANDERPTPEGAVALGYVYVAGADAPRDEVLDWASTRYALSGRLSAEDFVAGCQEAMLEQMRSPETVLFGDRTASRIDDEGVIRYDTFALSRSAAGATLRWGVRCTGVVDADVLHLWIEIEAR